MSDAALAGPEPIAPDFLRAPARRPPPDLDSALAWLSAQMALATAGLRSRRAARMGRLAAGRAEALAAAPEAFAARLAVARALARRRFRVLAPELLALAGEAARKTLKIAPYPAQFSCAAALIEGAVAEMETGEGKTIAAFLAASAYALAGRAVHVVTANDYLARRDAESLAPAYAALGLRVGVVVGGDEAAARRAAYRAEIVYLSGKEAAFDYLRDRLARPVDAGDGRLAAKLARVFGAPAEQKLQPRLDVALIDEVDSVLIDEAVTPLLISSNQPGEISVGVAREALDFAAQLEPGVDFTIDSLALACALTPAGQARLDAFRVGREGPWAVRLIREELVRAALGAAHVLRRDQHYLVRDGKIALIDQDSGRLTPDRHWSHGLSLMVEVKEGCQASGEKRALASISFQRFFRQYGALCGMSGTVREAAAELALVYGLKPAWIARHRPLRRVIGKRRVFADRDSLWREAARVADILQRRGQATLLGVRSVAEANRASAALQALGVAHRVLSAAQDGVEAEIVAQAGQAGAVAVVTNMAGRGTDIRLGAGVAEVGGLAVLICERHDSRRVDRQLIGRCARQGDPGLAIEFLSAEDAGLRRLSPLWRRLLARWPALLPLAMARAQARADRRHRAARLQLLRRDEKLARVMAFAGGLD